MTQSKAFWAIYISVGVSYLGVGLVAPLIALVLRARGADPFIVGLVGTTMFAAFTLASFPAGKATDRLGPKPILIGGLVVYGVSILLFALIENIPLFFIVRGVEGVGAAAISVATETMISQLSGPGERARRMSYYALSVGLGWAAGPISGTVLYSLRSGAPFVAGFALSLLAALLATLFIPRTRADDPHPEARFSGVSSLIVVPLSAGALYGYLMSSLVTLIPIYLKAIAIEEREMGFIITSVILGTLVSQVPIGRAADRFGKRRTLLVCSIILAALFAALPFCSDWRIFMLAGALTGAMAGSLYPVGLSIIGGIVSRDRLGAATSLFSLAFGIGSLVGPGLSGFAMNHLGNGWLFYLPSALTALFCLEMIALYQHTASRKR
ncbi:MAG TPA: MFS transporter [Blastocatellia bacterium]|nr:MFS transporter [Blastocatellia bacterium]